MSHPVVHDFNFSTSVYPVAASQMQHPVQMNWTRISEALTSRLFFFEAKNHLCLFGAKNILLIKDFLNLVRIFFVCEIHLIKKKLG